MNGMRLSATSRRTWRTVTTRRSATSSIVSRTGNCSTGNRWTVVVVVGAVEVVTGGEHRRGTSRMTTRIATRVGTFRREESYPNELRGRVAPAIRGCIIEPGGAAGRVRGVCAQPATTQEARLGREWQLPAVRIDGALHRRGDERAHTRPS